MKKILEIILICVVTFVGTIYIYKFSEEVFRKIKSRIENESQNFVKRMAKDVKRQMIIDERIAQTIARNAG